MKTKTTLSLILIAVLFSVNGFSNGSLFLNSDKIQQDLSGVKKSALFQPQQRKSRGGGGELDLGASLFYNIYFGGTGLKMMGLAVVGEYGTENLVYRGLFYYSFPKSQSFTTTANAYSSITNPSSIQVTGKIKISLMTIAIDAKKIFGGKDYDEGGFYGCLGAGLSIASEKTTMDSFDKTNYNAHASEDKQSFSQFLIRGALGYDARLDFGVIFGEALLSVPANSYNSRDGYAGEVSIPASFGIHAGIRIPLGN